MRKAAMFTAFTLLGGCAASVPAPSPPPVEPMVEAPEPPPAEEPPAQAAQPRPVERKRPQEIRIDNTSIEAFRASWDRLRTSLSPQQQLELNDAVARLTFANYRGATNLPMNLRNSPIVAEMIRDRIAGLTYAEIIALEP